MPKKTARLALIIALLMVCAVQAHAASVTIAWDPNPEPNVRYVVYWGTQHLVYTNSAAAGTSLSYVINNLSPGVTYYFAVQATTVDGLASPYSDEVSTTISTTATPPAAKVTGDFSGSGHTDFAVFRRSNGSWYVKGGQTVKFGTSEDIPVPGDYDGDGRMDIAVWRPSTGYWLLVLSSQGYNTASPVQVLWGDGTQQDVPVPADYDGDGKTDVAVWRPSSGVWYVLKSSDSFNWASYIGVQWGYGASQDVPVPGDVDGDGKADIVVWRPSDGNWYVRLSASGYKSFVVHQWGQAGDVPVPADYDGDGRMDLGIWRPSNGVWFIRKSSQNYAVASYQWVQWGLAAERDVPVPGDFDGDGKADIGIWRKSNGMWYVLKSSDNYSRSSATASQWGVESLNDTVVTGTVPIALSGLVTYR
jgi:hypothetical protein